MKRQPVRILIVDDHAVVRKGLAMVLRLEPDFEIVGEASDGRTALKKARELQPDLVLLDRIMPGMGGEEAIPALRALLPVGHILVLSGAELDEGLIDLLAAGVDGYVLKDVEPDELKDAIRAVARGEAYLHPSVARRLLDRLVPAAGGVSLARPARRGPPITRSPMTSPHPPFTARELEILQCMASPATYREIAGQLSISEETVRTHAKHILNKLGQPNRVQAILTAVRMGIISLPEDIEGY